MKNKEFLNHMEKNEFTLNDFECENLTNMSLNLLEDAIDTLNHYRLIYLHYEEIQNLGNDNVKQIEDLTSKEHCLYQIKMILPFNYKYKEKLK